MHKINQHRNHLTLAFIIAAISSFSCFISTLQAQTITLTFTGCDATSQNIPLEFVVITNWTKGWTETLEWPDTVLILQHENAIDESVSNRGFALLQNTPNPFNGTTNVLLMVADAGTVTLDIADGDGRIVGTFYETSLQSGTHQFRVTLATAGTYVMTARQNGKSSSIKMVCNGAGNGNRIEYLGTTIVETRCTTSLQQTKSTVTRPFNIGDQMEYVGYAIINGMEEESQIVTQALDSSQTVVLHFAGIQCVLPTVITASVSDITDTSAICGGTVTDDGGDSETVYGVCLSTSPDPTIGTRHTTDGIGTGTFTSDLAGLSSSLTYYVRAYATNRAGTAYGEEMHFTIPINPDGDTRSCPNTPTLSDRDGNVYNTVQIGEQCWMRENLRTTSYADGTPIAQGSSFPTSTGSWYYPMGETSYKSNYGLLYNWPAVVRGETGSEANPSGLQGICPDGWHVPSDAEWTQLTDYVSSHSEYVCGGDNINIAKAMISTAGWDFSSMANPCIAGNDSPATNNATSFGALPAGYGDIDYTNDFIYGGLGYYTNFWTATVAEISYYPVYYRSFHFNAADILRNYDYDYDSAKAVRCIRD